MGHCVLHDKKTIRNSWLSVVLRTIQMQFCLSRIQWSFTKWKTYKKLLWVKKLKFWADIKELIARLEFEILDKQVLRNILFWHCILSKYRVYFMSDRFRSFAMGDFQDLTNCLIAVFKLKPIEVIKLMMITIKNWSKILISEW